MDAQPKMAVPLLVEAVQGCGFVGVDFEDGEKFGELEEVMDLFCEMEELERAAAIFYAGVGADQLADARAIDVVHVGEIEEDEGAFVVEEFAHHLAKKGAAFPKSNATADVHDGDRLRIAICGSQSHQLG